MHCYHIFRQFFGVSHDESPMGSENYHGSMAAITMPERNWLFRARSRDRRGWIIATTQPCFPLTEPGLSVPAFICGTGGQPHDGDPRASFALLDTDNDTASIIRVPYDITKTADAIRAAGLPEFLAKRLTFGI